MIDRTCIYVTGVSFCTSSRSLIAGPSFILTIFNKCSSDNSGNVVPSIFCSLKTCNKILITLI